VVEAFTDKWHPRSDAGPQSQESQILRSSDYRSEVKKMRFYQKAISKARSYVGQVSRFSRLFFQKTRAFLGTERGNTSAEVALQLLAFTVSVTANEPLSGLLLGFALMALSRMRKK
jgi:hypothetical protein